MKTMPLCHKCASAEFIPDEDFDGAEMFVGCKECAEISDYNEAKSFCPLINEEPT